MIHRVTAICGIVLFSFAVLSVNAQSDADSKELQSYRLTRDNMKQFVAATRQMVAAAKSDPRYQALTKLETELEALEAKEEPSDADYARMEKLSAEIDAAEHTMPTAALNMSEHKTLSDMEAAIKKEPLMVNALGSAGMPPRDYAKFVLAFFQAAMLHGMQKSGAIKEIPKEMQAKVNMDNLKFIEENQAEINALMKEFQAASKQ
jgi:hypothetical protein